MVVVMLYQVLAQFLFLIFMTLQHSQQHLHRRTQALFLFLQVLMPFMLSLLLVVEAVAIEVQTMTKLEVSLVDQEAVVVF
jgi:hypothetical protein